MLAEVKVAYESNARQIPEMMRKLLGRIESGSLPAVSVLCVVEMTDHFEIFGWGDAHIEHHALLAYKCADALRDVAIKPPML